MTYVPRPKTYDDALREEILTEAARMLSDGGVERLSLRALASAAGTSTNAIYVMFGGKDALVSTVLDRARRSFIQAQQDAVHGENLIVDAKALGTSYRAWALANPELFKVMFGSGAMLTRSREGELMAPSENTLLLDVVGRLQDTGVFRGQDTASVVHSLWAMVHGYVTIELIFGIGNDADFERHIGAVFLAYRSRTSGTIERS